MLPGFHPLIRAWFAARYGEPTDVQARAWPLIASGQHVLACAPTGSGKTLTAFLWALDRLLTRAWAPGRLHVLYISPLKALNNDVQRNLFAPLRELRDELERASIDAPEVRVATRSGDTPSRERQRMLRKPPEILITTPESLNILMTSQGGRGVLETVGTVILDEIHAVAGNKRGTHLMTAVERLARLAGSFQRIALSATVKPLERIADFVAGFEMSRCGEQISYRRRPIEIVRAAQAKSYDLEVRTVDNVPLPLDSSDAAVWHGMVHDFCQRIAENRSTLVFTNSRRLAEKLTRLINESAAQELAYAHHGSLSREVRTVVERRLKEGKLKAIVATNSLELGIDIGALDEVLLVQSPPSVSSAVQRLGRAGHGVGETSRGRIYPSHDRDFLDAAVLVRSVLDGEIETARVVEAPLDVLAQVILSMTTTESWQLDELYAFIRTCDPYHDLPRRQFDLVIDMLAGRYADTRLRTLKPRLHLDRIDSTVRAQQGVPHLLYTAGGTIPDRGTFHLRVADSRAKVGELDEEFVWERSIGDTFVLGTQAWRVENITHNEVIVTPATTRASMAPFWRAEERLRSFHLSDMIGRLLEELDGRLEDEATLLMLRDSYRMTPEAGTRLLDFLKRQRAATGGPLPHRHHVVIEHYSDPRNVTERKHVVLHTLWGGEVNRPFGMALGAAWEERYGYPIEVAHEDDSLIVALPHDFDSDNLLDLVSASRVEELLRRKLEHSGFFGARFRENAGRALLLPRGGFRQRLPLWLNRLRSKKILAAVSSYGDFPIVVETWRTCLKDAFDLDALRQVLDEIARGEIAISEVTTEQPSPFAAQVIYRHTNAAMYGDDTPIDAAGSRLRPELVRELVFSPQLRPRVELDLVHELVAKLHRTAPGYAPCASDDLITWVKERLLIPDPEWRTLLDAIDDHEILDRVADRLVRLDLRHGGCICALEDLPRLRIGLGIDKPTLETIRGGVPGPAIEAALDGLGMPTDDDGEPLDEHGEQALRVELIGQWLGQYGPLGPEVIGRVWHLSDTATARAIEALEQAERVIVDEITSDAGGPQVCDVDNLETLLRTARARARPSFEVLGIEHLPLFFATHQGLTHDAHGRDDLRAALERLFGFPAAAATWEADLLPARLDPYVPAWLDELLGESELTWIGCGKEKLTFLFGADLDLIFDDAPEAPADASEIFPAVPGRFNLADLSQHSGRSSTDLSRDLWALAWAARVTNDTFTAVRRGVLNRFQPVEPQRDSPRRARQSRGAFDRWRASRPFVGSWYLVDIDAATLAPRDAVDEEERNKERVRLLLARYGVLFRELLGRELPAMQWSRLFRSLRLMELSGEVLAGRFFEGIDGPQFISHAAFRRLQAGLDRRAIYWMVAVDPASPAGLGLQALGAVPRRLAGNHLVYRGTELVLVSQRYGRELTLSVEPDDPDLPACLAPLEVMLAREFNSLRGIEVETINSELAPASRYRDALSQRFAVSKGPRTLRLERRYV